MFKLVGVIAGYYFFGLFGALFGFLLGLAVDRVRALGQGALNPLRNAIRQAVFLETVFILMGRLAKVDGRVSEQEIAHAEQLMRRMELTSEHRQQAMEFFRQGVDPEFDLEPTYRKFIVMCGHTRNLKEMLLVYLVVMAMADGRYHPEEERLLTDIAGRLGYGPEAFRRLKDMVLNQTHFAGGEAPREAALDEAYKALGVGKDSSDAEVKRAYRKLMSRYHPDKLTGQGMPEDMVRMATEQAKEIQLAYDLIKQQRGR